MSVVRMNNVDEIVFQKFYACYPHLNGWVVDPSETKIYVLLRDTSLKIIVLSATDGSMLSRLDSSGYSTNLGHSKLILNKAGTIAALGIQNSSSKAIVWTLNVSTLSLACLTHNDIYIPLCLNFLDSDTNIFYSARQTTAVPKLIMQRIK